MAHVYGVVRFADNIQAKGCVEGDTQKLAAVLVSFEPVPISGKLIAEAFATRREVRV